MAYRGSRPTLHAQKGLSPGSKILLLMGIVAILSCVGGAVIYSVFLNTQIELDANTGCPIDGPTSRTIIVIDQTDTFTPVQAVDIQNQFEAYKNSIPRYGELVVYTIGSQVEAIQKPVIRACNPGTEKDVDKLVESSIRVVRRWKEFFDKPMRNVIASVLQPTESDASPIIETIQAVVVKEFGPSNMDNTSKSLVVVSDLLQHSSALSQYGRAIDLKAFTLGDTFKKLSADLRDVKVDILYLYRNTHKNLQTNEHRKFWIGLFQAQNGVVNKFYSVSG